MLDSDCQLLEESVAWWHITKRFHLITCSFFWSSSLWSLLNRYLLLSSKAKDLNNMLSSKCQRHSIVLCPASILSFNPLARIIMKSLWGNHSYGNEFPLIYLYANKLMFIRNISIARGFRKRSINFDFPVIVKHVYWLLKLMTRYVLLTCQLSLYCYC